MNHAIALVLAIITSFFLTALPTEIMAADLSGQLVISGSDTLEPMIVDMAKGFMSTHSGVKIVVQGGGSGKGIADTRNGSAAIGMVSRALTSHESVDLRAFTIAFDGFCFVTSKKNPVQTLTPAQLEGIFLGKIGNWKDVGGTNLPITTLIRDRASSSNKVVAEFLGVRDTDLKGTVINDSDMGIKIASKDPKTVFYVSTGEAFHEKLSGMPLNILAISGKKATMKTIAQNIYPLTRPLSLVTKGNPGPLANAFISYCQSKAAIPVIRTHYFIKPE
jgi:phosphate transport system substrate-binding protein